MKIKKYPQSHLVITNDLGKKIVIDPGYLTYEKGFMIEEFADIDGFLITHQHEDHLDPKTIAQLVNSKPVFGNSDVVSKLKSLEVNATEVKDRQKFSVAGFNVEAVDLPHFQKTDGTLMPPNTGFLIDGIFFHPGDGVDLSGVTSPNSAVVVSGPPNGPNWFEKGLSLAQNLSAKVVIPIHFDKYPTDTKVFAEMAQGFGIIVYSLSSAEEIDLS